MTPIENTIERLLRLEPGLRLAALFGSASRGELRPGSDLDVGVLGSCPRRLSALETALGRATGRRTDIVALETAPPLLRFEIARDARLLFERVPHEWSDFRARAMVDWWDWAPTARLFHRAAAARLRGQVGDGAS